MEAGKGKDEIAPKSAANVATGTENATIVERRDIGRNNVRRSSVFTATSWGMCQASAPSNASASEEVVVEMAVTEEVVVAVAERKEDTAR